MPSRSASQARMMAAAAHDPAFAKKVGVPVSVAKEFNAADAGTGMIHPKGMKQCPTCGGSGEVHDGGSNHARMFAAKVRLR